MDLHASEPLFAIPSKNSCCCTIAKNMRFVSCSGPGCFRFCLKQEKGHLTLSRQGHHVRVLKELCIVKDVVTDMSLVRYKLSLLKGATCIVLDQFKSHLDLSFQMSFILKTKLYVTK